MLVSKFVKDRSKRDKIADNLSTSNLVLLGLLCFTSYHALTKKPIIQWTPPYITERITVGHKSASAELHIKYAMSTSLLLGNVTPKTVDDLIDALSVHFSPALYHKLLVEFESQAQHIKDTGDTLEFHPSIWEFEPETGLTFVTGKQIIRANVGEELEKTITYEFKIKVDNYVPQIEGFDFYSGPAHNKQWRISESDKSAQSAT